MQKPASENEDSCKTARKNVCSPFFQKTGMVESAIGTEVRRIMAAQKQGCPPKEVSDTRLRIADLLKSRKKSQADLAAATGISESTISRFVSGNTDKLSTENIVAIARFFNVSTDFIMCLTDVERPSSSEIQALGFSVKAGERLIQKTVDPETLSLLIEMPLFAKLINQLKLLREGTYAANYGSINGILKQACCILDEFTINDPDDRRAAKEMIENMRALRPAPLQVETAHIEETFHLIMEDIKKGALKYSQEYEKLTSEIMGQITSNLRKRLNNPMKLQGITPEMIADSVVASLARLELDEEKQAEIRSTMLKLCSDPHRLAEQNKPESESQHEGSGSNLLPD